MQACFIGSCIISFFRLISFGYDWKESINTEENFSPLSMTYAHLTNRTQAFDDLLSSNPFLQNSFEEQFVIGQSYSFTNNDQLEKDRTNYMYFKGGIDVSGNLLGLVQSLFVKHKATPGTPYLIFGTPYSQYYKFDIDMPMPSTREATGAGADDDANIRLDLLPLFHCHFCRFGSPQCQGLQIR